jgi:hypothetical protein
MTSGAIRPTVLTLATYTLWRGYQARIKLTTAGPAPPGALDDLSRTLITLFTGFVVILANNLGGPVWLVIAPRHPRGRSQQAAHRRDQGAAPAGRTREHAQIQRYEPQECRCGRQSPPVNLTAQPHTRQQTPLSSRTRTAYSLLPAMANMADLPAPNEMICAETSRRSASPLAENNRYLTTALDSL